MSWWLAAAVILAARAVRMPSSPTLPNLTRSGSSFMTGAGPWFASLTVHGAELSCAVRSELMNAACPQREASRGGVTRVHQQHGVPRDGPLAGSIEHDARGDAALGCAISHEPHNYRSQATAGANVLAELAASSARRA
jgi:hypothetical protein